jgi:hypothetical protein
MRTPMAEHEPSIGLSSDWFTPKPIFDALGLVFDLADADERTLDPRILSNSVI